jgi:hypothetical protein
MGPPSSSNGDYKSRQSYGSIGLKAEMIPPSTFKYLRCKQQFTHKFPKVEVVEMSEIFSDCIGNYRYKKIDGLFKFDRSVTQKMNGEQILKMAEMEYAQARYLICHKYSEA